MAGSGKFLFDLNELPEEEEEEEPEQPSTSLPSFSPSALVNIEDSKEDTLRTGFDLNAFPDHADAVDQFDVSGRVENDNSGKIERDNSQVGNDVSDMQVEFHYQQNEEPTALTKNPEPLLTSNSTQICCKAIECNGQETKGLKSVSPEPLTSPPKSVNVEHIADPEPLICSPKSIKGNHIAEGQNRDLSIEEEPKMQFSRDRHLNDKDEGELNDKEEGECSDKEDMVQPSRIDSDMGACSAENSHVNVDENSVDLETATSAKEVAGDYLNLVNLKNDSARTHSKEIKFEKDKKGCVTNNSIHSRKPEYSCNSMQDDIKKDSTADSLELKNGEGASTNGQLKKQKSTATSSIVKAKGSTGSESRYITWIGNKRKVDEETEAKLGKKRSRQTVFLNIEDVKRATTNKFPSNRRQLSGQSSTNSTGKDNAKASHSAGDGGEPSPVHDTQESRRKLHRSEDHTNTSSSNFDKVSRAKAVPWSKRPGNVFESSSDALPSSMSRQPSFGQGTTDQRFSKKYNGSFKKHGLVNEIKDTSVERLHREVTCEKFWHHPDEAELQCVPGRFDSAEEYVRVFEPLLFEESRAQLYSTYEELCDTCTRDSCIMVRVKKIDRRERGWYDVTVIPMNELKMGFKEGDMAVLSMSKDVAGRLKCNAVNGSDHDDNDVNPARVAGTVRRYCPFDNRDPQGAIVHFYVGDLDYSSNLNEGHILMKLQKNSLWYLTVLGSLATTQREYKGLHAFKQLNAQMQLAILDPRPEQFPKYDESPPAMPECFTPSFLDHLHKTFNGPQLAAIQWAAMHTAAGTGGGSSLKRQEPWPFTLVQGPPGTGKTHTVWGMLNVIHLVQYQRYYCSLLKKLAPDCYAQCGDKISSVAASGSIEEVLQNMDRSFYMITKNCPKPRMLVCAPSNAATDELLQRVLERGFIDGEMKIYRPDVARVGVDTQNRSAQAVSVERRSDNLLARGPEEVMGHLQQLYNRRLILANQITAIRRELKAVAEAGRAQGSIGVDPDVLISRDHSRDSMLQNLAAVVEEHDKISVEISRLEVVADRYEQGSRFNIEEARSTLEASFANEAEIVFTTVSSSGRKLFQHLTHGFDMVVIDEAAQASEVAVLPPLSLGAARCVLVGDPQQLPATVISQAAGTLLYSRSLFERFQQAGCPTMLLSVQYRMHPQIREFPSRYFYQNRLSDSESVINRSEDVYHRDPLLKPYLFYDVTHGRESHKGSSVSYQNIHEAQFAVKLYEHLQKLVKEAGVNVSVGIITPYKLQLKCLQREFESILATEDGKTIYINTVDAFQGQERDVIIMSCVRASRHGVGFVSDIRRMNVALTRARKCLWVLGNAAALKQSSDWSALIEDAKERGCYKDMESIPKEVQLQISSQTRVRSNTRFLKNSSLRHSKGHLNWSSTDFGTFERARDGSNHAASTSDKEEAD